MLRWLCVFIRLVDKIIITLLFLEDTMKQHHIVDVKIVYKHNMTHYKVNAQRGMGTGINQGQIHKRSREMC